jgi:hypothetical protein
MKLLVLKAIVGLICYDVLRFGCNLARIHRRVRSWQVSSRKPMVDIVDKVCEAVNYACILYPKRVRCLQKSAVATCLLRTYGVRAQMVIGAQPIPFKAHAWTEVAGHPVNERKEVQHIYGVWERC